MSNFIGTFLNDTKLSFSKPLEGLSGKETFLSDGTIKALEKDGVLLYLSGNVYGLSSDNAESEILSGYLEKGIESFKNLDGEFTLVLTGQNKVVIYRDRHGAGPQVYFSNTHFSSVLKNFLSLDNYYPEANGEAIHTFLSIGYIPSPMCSLKGIQKLPAGHILEVVKNNQKIIPLYTWESYLESCSNPTNLSEEEATLQYEKLHKQSILNRVKDKNSVGLLLSGGYDSGGNIAGLRDVYSGKVYSYSIGFKDNPWTELPLAKILSERFDTEHAFYEIDGTEIKELPELINYLGDPFQEGGLMVNYTAMKLIGDNKPEIILGGDGNDQHFGTAGKELALNYSLRKNGGALLQKFYAGIGQMEMFNKDNILFRTQFHNHKILNIQKSDNFGFSTFDLKKLYSSKKLYGSHKYLEAVPKHFKDFDDFYFAHNYFGDIRQVINEVILFKASKMASMFGNNLSFPYMSTDIYNFLQQLPRNLKTKGTVKELSKGQGVSKFLHKNYLKPKLPVEITDRKKQGGFAPLPIFFKDNTQRSRLVDFIMNSDAAMQLFSREYLENFFASYDQTVKTGGYWFWYKQVKAFQFFNLLVVCLWWEMFINGTSSDVLKSYLN